MSFFPFLSIISWVTIGVASGGEIKAPPLGPANVSEPAPIARETREITGWAVRIDRRLLDERNLAATDKAVGLLKSQLDEIVRVVPAAAVAELRKVPLYFSRVYPGISPRAEYHPSAGWLRENRRDPAMAKGVEFTNIEIFEDETKRMPNFALHELAHAFHDRVLPDGFGNPEIADAFRAAKTGGNYDRVERRDGKGNTSRERAYAMTNPQEYFAETTEAWFSRNDFQPYDRAGLRVLDPAMATLLEKLWVKP